MTMEEWKEYKIGDVCSRLRSGKNIKADSVRSIGKYPVIGGNGVRGYTDVSNFEGQAAVIGRQGAYCGNVRFFEGEAYMTEHAVVAVGNELADTRFLASLLSMMHLGNLSAQSAQPGVSVQTLSKQIVRLPPISYQKRVSSILKSLDDKISLNKRINDNLEQQAQALFKHWFIDFGPFKNGEFIESELGMIPKGWRVGKFGDIADLIKPSIKPETGVVYNHYSIPAFDNNQIPSRDKGEAIKSNKFAIQDSVIMLSKLNPDHKRIWYVDKIEANAVCSTEFLPFYAKNREHSAFVYCYLSNKHIYREIANGAKGTTNSHQRIDANAILSKDLAYHKDSISQFCNLVGVLLKKQNHAVQESRRLATLRDTLLPKLMSGQIKL